jgi:hypothetical protein
MAESFVLLESIRVNSSATTVTFDNLPTSGYTDLKILVSARTSRANPTDSIYMRLNGDAGSNYVQYRLYAFAAASATADTYTATGFDFSPVQGNSATGGFYSNNELYLTDFLSSTTKTVSWMSVAESDSASAGNGLVQGQATWSGTAPITSISLHVLDGNNFATGSTFYLYGLSNSETIASAPKAIGGNVITNDATYWYHAFLSSGTFTAKQALTCDILAIGGGGSGGANLAGGGGAGGVLNLTSQAILAGNYSVQVGAGGNQQRGGDGNRGGDSKFGTLTSAVGGGRGGSINGAFNAALLAGGSGGGGYATGGAGTAGQGNNGGSNSGSANSAGGGGGASAAGSGGGGYGGGAGGAGTSSFSSWGAVTGTGVNSGGTYYYAGGGGGGGDGSSGSGGIGGGGAAGVNGTAGTINTGGGGGGSFQSGASRMGGAGGSGLVIVRYPRV